MHPNQNPPVYSYNFACNVLLSFLEKYGRATTIIAHATELSPESFNQALIRAIRTNQFRWKAYKKMIKMVNSDPGVLQILEDKGIPVADKLKYLTYIKYIAQDILLDDGISVNQTTLGLRDPRSFE